ncbi:hypothetical protein GCM10023321_74010 [Pseudonocardia eucalypti]|uniref:PucR C-terminal helix-turn-helix domain-containing protein n=1 Tax=Pseudonocardia eucalypti TaxID=648755 RepID=A0ABP9R8U6_9PSEU|nr:hypothetical protein [Pseudonocardia eucalypti]
MDAHERLNTELDRLAVRIGRNVSIDDPAGRLIGYSSQDGAVDAARVSTILARQVPQDVLAWQDSHGIRDAVEPVLVAANPALKFAARVCVPIRRGAACLGYLWILSPNEPVAPEALRAATRCANDVAGLVAEVAGVTAPDDRDTVVRRLLTDPTADPENLLARQPELYNTDVQVLVAVPKEANQAAVAPLSAAEFSRLSGALPSALRGHGDNLGSFVTATHLVAMTRGTPERLPGQLEQLLEEDRFRVGISAPARFDVSAARAAYRQALAAAELSALDPTLPARLPWALLGPYRTLLDLPGTSAATLATALAPLDGAANSAAMLLDTLETYLDLGGDAGRTAGRLRLHRTSLYYRLGRIAELLGADLDNGLTRLELHLALKSRRLARRTLAGSVPED